MGIMQGKIDGDTMIVMDAFALPVEGTETRVNAQAEAYEYMVDFSQTNKRVRPCKDAKPSNVSFDCFQHLHDVTVVRRL